MLFVDDGQCEVAEGDTFLHQCMGADHDLRVAGCDFLQHLAARLARDLACEPCHPHAQGFEPATQVVEMLLGQQLGRRHQGGLLADFHCLHRGQRSHHGLAAADVALYQPQHGRGFAEVRLDLVEDAPLRTGEFEGQGLAQLAGQRRAAQRGRRMRLLRQALAAQAQVMGEELLQCQAPLRRMAAGEQCGDVLSGLRAMHGEQGLAQRWQVQRLAQCARQQLQ